MPTLAPKPPARLARWASASNSVLTSSLQTWFAHARRDLPWRRAPRDPYHALVAESMLQQTQVARVIDYFGRFIASFPDVRALAAADEQDVMALWSGLGYYRRARNLHAAATMIVERFVGEVPRAVQDLLTLPGVGRYTAGAIASIAFDQPAAIVDGNVLRVLLRVRGKDLDPGDKATAAWAWRESAQLVSAATDPAAFNEGLMELGATVCLPPPAAPACLLCPWRESCRAHTTGRARDIPRPKKPRPPRDLFAAALVITRASDHAVLMERRPEKGMWAGMWQVPTLERDDRPATTAEVAGLVPELKPRTRRFAAPAKVAQFIHQTTHRTLHFAVWRATLAARATGGRRWVLPGELAKLGISNAARKVLSHALKPASS